MERPTQQSSDSAIRITVEEANSNHVDDLIQRQRNLRGEMGISRTHRRRWYYQNWFVLLMAGMAAAFVAWAIIEPYFNDLEYFQGRIDRVAGPNLSEETDSDLKVVTIRGEEIFLSKKTIALHADGRKEPLDLDSLRMGKEFGVYVDGVDQGNKVFNAGIFVVPSPPPQPMAQAGMSLSHLRARSQAAGLLLFPLVAGFVGLAIGAIDGLICRLPRRALLCGAVGFLAGFIGGFLSCILAGLVYMPLNHLAMRQTGTGVGFLTPFGFFVQTTGRGLAWCLAGMAMGLGQGIALRSKRLLLYGFLGGIIGGLFGGLLFDPIDLLLLGQHKPSAHWSRMIGLLIIGGSVGGMIGVVELLARDAWLQMIKGPLAGKEFLIFKDVMNIGSSPRCEIYLFNDSYVSDWHATLRATGEICEIDSRDLQHPILLNNHPIKSSRLRHGDRILIGQTEFVFQTRGGR